jgi:hypothetical protein
MFNLILSEPIWVKKYFFEFNHSVYNKFNVFKLSVFYQN